MCIFKTKFGARISIAKSIGFLFGLIAFLFIPLVFKEADMMLRIAVFFWYTTLGGLIGLFGLMDRHPVFTNIPFPFWFRGIFLGAWMNFVLVLFMHDNLLNLMQGSILEGYSPYRIVVEGLIIGLIIEFFATKFGGEGKELIK